MPSFSNDPTRVTAQPALTSSKGRAWLVMGGLLTLVALGVLVPMAALKMEPAGVPLTAAIVVVTLYVGMVIVRLATPPGRLRLALLAVDMLAIAFVALVATVLVAEYAAVV